MTATYSEIPFDHLTVPISADFRADWYVDDAETGLPAAWGVDWSARMQIRETAGGTLIATMSTTSDDGTIIFGDDGNLSALLPAAFTATLAPIASAVFDLEITDPDGGVTRAVEGRVRITREVTQ